MQLIDLSLLADYVNKPKNKSLEKDFVEKIRKFLSDPDLESTHGKRRIVILCQNFNQFTFEQAYHFIDPEGFQKEYEDVHRHKGLLSLLVYSRTLLALVPLIWTWFTLSNASNEYQKDLIVYPNDKTVSFLRLWQEGFHGTTWLTFSTATFINVILLSILFGVTFYALTLERQSRRQSREFVEQLHQVVDGLMKVVKSAGITPITSDDDIDLVVEAFKGVVEELFRTSQEVVKDASTGIAESNKSMKDLVEHRLPRLVDALNAAAKQIGLSLSRLNVNDIMNVTSALQNVVFQIHRPSYFTRIKMRFAKIFKRRK